MLRTAAQLERAIAQEVSAVEALVVGSGRTALWAALRAARVEGHLVALPDFICAQVIEAVRRAEGRPIFYRITPVLRVDEESFCRVMRKGCRAAVVVDFFGQVEPAIGELLDRARSQGVVLIEDAALAWGARWEGRPAGSFGDFAVFSFTKTGWNYGGGMVVTRREEFRGSLRALRAELRPSGRLALTYGMLRRLDFAANRVRWARWAGWAGRCAQRMFLPQVQDFYEAARYDAAAWGGALRRALRELRTEPERLGRRRRIVQQLLDHPAWRQILLRPAGESGDSCAYVLLRSPLGEVERWRQWAAAKGVTLRLSWPRYQELVAEQHSPVLAQLAQQLLILEIHPDWTEKEIRHIGQVVGALASDRRVS